MLQQRDFWLGATLGSFAMVLALEPTVGVLTSVVAPNARLEKLQHRLTGLQANLVAPDDELIKKIELQRDKLAMERAAVANCNRKVADLELGFAFKTGSVADGGERACLRETPSMTDLTLKEAEAARLVAGRLYVGLQEAWTASGAGCSVNYTSDAMREHSNARLGVGEGVDIETTVGEFRLVVTSVPDGVSCKFDLVRMR